MVEWEAGGKARKKEVGKMGRWEKGKVEDGEIPEGGSGTRRRPKRTGLWRGYRCGLRPAGAIGATLRREGGKERMRGPGDGEVWKDLKR